MAEKAVYSIDIDIGGTFTDGFFTDGGEVRTEKVITTPHDITECFMNCVAAGCAAFGVDLAEFLRRTAVVRVSTTVGTNLLVQRAGPKLGLLVTAGCEESLYGADRAAILDRYIPAKMVAGVDEQVDDRGAVLREVDEAAVLGKVRELIRSGARMIVTSFRNAWRNPHNERRVRALILARYPVHYLRSVPLQLGTEIAHVADDHARTNSAVLNAYIHGDLARALYRAEDKLREAGYERPLLVVHASGGTARVAKTVALQTLQSGPAVAAQGAAYLATLLGERKVIEADMGGTSFDLAIIVDGRAAFNGAPMLDDISVAVPMIETESLGAGGGSIARVDGGVLRVGPRSAGSAPGPACYGKGGMEPTVTDANLVLGYLDPESFLGGRMRLDVAAARRVIERRICRPLGLSIEEAAFDIRECIDGSMAEETRKRLLRKGLAPADMAFFPVGGGGAVHACAIATRAGIERIVAFPFGSVFSAFGGSTTNVQHIYLRTVSIRAAMAQQVEAILPALREQALLDMQGEGFSPAEITFSGQCVARRGDHRRVVELPAGGRKHAAARVIAAEAKGATIESVRLVATAAVAHWTPIASRLQRRAPVAAPRATRSVYWERGHTRPTPIYDRDALTKGQVIRGPAIVEGPDTSYAIAPNWLLKIDRYGNFIVGLSSAGPATI
ncbi:MAG: hypothetical protein A3G80_03085 [Betaproteobacteria bacterium RIFCSPLOWO2_12_FULL_62_13b]|nr:MAG: hypothetical protein A3G80_03085 [Betaproteobacteria bacterium RIFCSPLOWO2_12_FULL_62_13b]